MNQVTISIVIPVYSGAQYLERLTAEIERLKTTWDAQGAPVTVAEVIFVNDEAIDNSHEIVSRLAPARPWIVDLHLSRNYGQHGATIAGILHSSGDWVVTLDEDMQHPPSRISDLLSAAVAEGFDVVYARPASKAVHGAWWRDWSSRTFKRQMEWLTGNPTLRMVNSYRMMRGPIARATASVCSHNTYFDIALYWFTQRISSVEMPLRDERFAETGRSGYNFKRLVQHAHKMLFSSQLRFLSLGVWIGIGLFVVSFLAAAYFTILRIAAPAQIGVEGWTSLFLAVCLSSGLLAIMLGICLQYLSTLVVKAHGRPTFFTIDRSGDHVISQWLREQTPLDLEKGDAA